MAVVESNEVQVTPTAAAPSAVLNATPGDSKVTLNWTTNGSFQSWTLQRKVVSGGVYATIATGPPSTTTYLDQGSSQPPTSAPANNVLHAYKLILTY
jgi:hypothetical protein